VIVCRSRYKAEEARRIVESVLGRLKLKLHPVKTRCVQLDGEGFDFLGFHFQKLRSKRSGRLAPYAWPSQKAMKSVRERIRNLTLRRRLHVELAELVASLNAVIGGWRNYFQVGNASKQLTALDRYVRDRLWRFLSGRQGSRGRLIRKAFGYWVSKSGLTYFYPAGRGRMQTCMP
jgi:RNA-directed DNA polymerase